jgi:hypothetical protein
MLIQLLISSMVRARLPVTVIGVKSHITPGAEPRHGSSEGVRIQSGTRRVGTGAVARVYRFIAAAKASWSSCHAGADPPLRLILLWMSAPKLRVVEAAQTILFGHYLVQLPATRPQFRESRFAASANVL